MYFKYSIITKRNYMVLLFFCIGDVEYQCQWRGCGRIKKSAPPFPNMQRLSRHVRDVHLLKSTGRCVPSQDRSKLVRFFYFNKPLFIIIILFKNFK